MKTLIALVLFALLSVAQGGSLDQKAFKTKNVIGTVIVVGTEGVVVQSEAGKVHAGGTKGVIYVEGVRGAAVASRINVTAAEAGTVPYKAANGEMTVIPKFRVQ